MNYRRIAERFQIEGAVSLKDLINELNDQLNNLPADKADGVERILVEHLENALADVFSLECAIEDVYTEGE